MLVGLLEPALNAGNLVFKRRVLAGSLIEGMPETQAVLDFCAENDVRCDIEMTSESPPKLLVRVRELPVIEATW